MTVVMTWQPSPEPLTANSDLIMFFKLTNKTKFIWNCPHCHLETTHVDELDVAAQHLWEVHGVPSEFRINGELHRYGPEAIIDRAVLTWFRTHFPLQRTPEL